MAITSDILRLIDNGIDPGLVATLAGLSLATAAFYAPMAAKIIKETAPELEKSERDYQNRLNRAVNHGYPEDLVMKEKVEKLNSIIKGAELAQKSLIKAFMIFVFFVVYSISIDQAICAETSTALFKIFGFPNVTSIPLGVDTTISVLFLWFGGINLWTGALEIGKYFDINFKEEQEKIAELRKNVAALVNDGTPNKFKQKD